MAEAYQLHYKGYFENDSRSGIGLNYYGMKNNCDFYKGNFLKDLPEGRGIYVFNTFSDL